jgi:hypothetical protein
MASAAASSGMMGAWRVGGTAASLSSQRSLVPSSLGPTAAPSTRRTAAFTVVRAAKGKTKSRSKKSASPIKAGKSKTKAAKAAAAAAAVLAKPTASQTADPTVGPVAQVTQSMTLADILAQDLPMQIIKPAGEPAGGGGGGGFGRDPGGGGGGWADALAEYRSDSVAKETARNRAKAQFAEEDESFFEVGDGSNIVAFGAVGLYKLNPVHP